MPIFPTGYTNGTPATDDRIMFSDTSASNQTKDCAISELPISIDTQTALNQKANTTDVNNALALKQNTLTPGANITIVGDVISSVGGGGGVINGLNVKDYGAIGDGIADDTTAFQNTVNATGVNGGRIIIPYGTYNLTTFPSIGTKSIYFDIDVGARFNGAGYPAMNTNYGQVAVGPYIKSQSDYVSPISNGGIATYNIEMIQPSTYVGQSVGLYVGARGSSPDVDANVWAINPLITANAGAGGTYQCIEVDVNNNSADAIVKGVSVSGLGNYNPDVAFEAVRADETRWKVGMELHHNIIGMILHGNIASGYEAIKIENLSSANTTNKGIINRYYGRTFNTPTTKQIANIEINPVDPNWTDCRYTINLMEDSTLKSAFEIKQDGVFFGFDTISQTHKIRQGDGSTQFRNTSLQYIELKTDNNYHYITGTVNASTGGSASGKEILIENKDQAGLRYKFNGVEVGRVTNNGSIIIGKVTDDGSYLQVSNASASGIYATIKRGVGGFEINLDATYNALNSTGKVMKLGTLDNLPIDFFTNGTQRVRLNTDGTFQFIDIATPSTKTNRLYTTSGIIYFNGNGLYQTINTGTVTATGGQTVVTVGTYVIGNNKLQVFVNGLEQLLTTDYTETSTTSITFTSGLTAGDIVKYRILS